jgi:hypothetical protein
MKSKDQTLLEEAYDEVQSSSVKIPQFKFMQAGKEHLQGTDDDGPVNLHAWDLMINGEKVGTLKEYGRYGEVTVEMVAPLAKRSSTPGYLSLDLSGFERGDTTIEKFKLALQTKTGRKFLMRLKELGATYIH